MLRSVAALPFASRVTGAHSAAICRRVDLVGILRRGAAPYAPVSVPPESVVSVAASPESICSLATDVTSLVSSSPASSVHEESELIVVGNLLHHVLRKAEGWYAKRNRDVIIDPQPHIHM